MNRSDFTPAGERPIDSMVELARCSQRHRIILAGANAPQHMFELHRRGYNRVATTTTCGLPRGQYDVALVDWQHSIKALETTLDWLVHFLAPSAVLVIRIESDDRAGNRKLTAAMERLGFQIEAGTRCKQGTAVSARRRDAAQMAVAA
jgi:hypothetical protein